ncbi:hypothetical protein HPB47_022160, partial [Ixodes persulcatus]
LECPEGNVVEPGTKLFFVTDRKFIWCSSDQKIVLKTTSMERALVLFLEVYYYIKYINTYPFKSHVGTPIINHEYDFKNGWLTACQPYCTDSKTYILPRSMQ